MTTTDAVCETLACGRPATETGLCVLCQAVEELDAAELAAWEAMCEAADLRAMEEARAAGLDLYPWSACDGFGDDDIPF